MINPQINFDGKFHRGKGGILPGVWLLWSFSAAAPSLGWGAGGGLWETAVPCWAVTSCLQRASSLGREKGQRDKCQMDSSVTPYEMPLIVARRRPFTATSGGKTGVSWLQGRRQRCADAVNDIRPRTCKQFWKWNGDTARPEIFRVTSTVEINGDHSWGDGSLCLPNIQAALPLNTSPILLGRDTPFPTLALSGAQKVDASPTSGRWSQKPGLTNQHVLLCQSRWGADGGTCAKGESYSTTSIP